jgi:hypothetical protein
MKIFGTDFEPVGALKTCARPLAVSLTVTTALSAAFVPIAFAQSAYTTADARYVTNSREPAVLNYVVCLENTISQPGMVRNWGFEEAIRIAQNECRMLPLPNNPISPSKEDLVRSIQECGFRPGDGSPDMDCGPMPSAAINRRPAPPTGNPAQGPLPGSTSAAQVGSTGQAENVYAASVFNFCDAKMLADFWDVDVSRSKVLIGQQILADGGAGIPEKLRQSRQAGNRCEWGDLHYDYDDAAKIAQIWTLGGGANEAKSKIAMLATAGMQNWVDAALGHCGTDSLGKDYSLPDGQC